MKTPILCICTLCCLFLFSCEKDNDELIVTDLLPIEITSKSENSETITTYTYDESLRIQTKKIKIILSSGEEIIQIDNFQYDTNGLLITKESSIKNGDDSEITSTEKYIYKGNIVNVHGYNDRIIKRCVLDDKNEQVISFTYFDSMSLEPETILYEINYTYDSIGNVISAEDFTPHQIVNYKYEHKYDNKNNIYKYVNSLPCTLILIGNSRTTNNLIQSVSHAYWASSGTLQYSYKRKSEYEYNQAGFPIQETAYLEDEEGVYQKNHTSSYKYISIKELQK